MHYYKNNTMIEYQIIRKKIKHTYFRIKNNILVITTNYALKSDEIIKLIDEHYDNIIDKMNKMSNFMPNDNEIYFKGKKYKKIVIPYFENKVSVIEDEFIIYTKKNQDDYIRKIILNYYSNYLEIEVSRYKEKLDEMFKLSAKIIYKPLKSAYGKNYIRKNEIIISIFLAKFDSKYIPYILAHEYTHFKYPNHQKEFHQLFDKIFPENKKYRKEIISDTKKIGLF